MHPDYLALIRRTRSPEKAALYIRAMATTVAAKDYCFSDSGRLGCVVEAERRAQILERPWDENSGPKPWRKWLKEFDN